MNCEHKIKNRVIGTVNVSRCADCSAWIQDSIPPLEKDNEVKSMTSTRLTWLQSAAQLDQIRAQAKENANFWETFSIFITGLGLGILGTLLVSRN